MNGISAVFYYVDRPKQLGWRIANLIADTLQIPFFTSKSRKIPRHLDLFIYVNGLDAFADPDWRAYMANLTTHSQYFVFVQNDYALRPPISFQDAHQKAGKPWKPVYWSTIPLRVEHSEQWQESGLGAVINWNAIGFTPVFSSTMTKPRFPGLFYYGDLRPERATYLYDYFGDQVPYPTTVSAVERSHVAYRRLLGEKVQLIIPLEDLYRQLPDWDATVYIEDKYSHQHFTSPATRFYECLTAGVAQFIDFRAEMTLAAFPIGPYIVHDAKEVADLLPRARWIAVEQQKAFAPMPTLFRTQLQDALLKAYVTLHRRPS